jgi:hypothetical protein
MLFNNWNRWNVPVPFTADRQIRPLKFPAIEAPNKNAARNPDGILKYR